MILDRFLSAAFVLLAVGQCAVWVLFNQCVSFSTWDYIESILTLVGSIAYASLTWNFRGLSDMEP